MNLNGVITFACSFGMGKCWCWCHIRIDAFGGIMVGLVFCLGKREKSSDKDDMESPRADSGFMSVLTDEDEFIPYDRGYETDVDVLRTETDALLPSHMKRKKKIRKPDYGSTTNSINGTNGSTTLPRDIGNIRSTFKSRKKYPRLLGKKRVIAS